MEFMADLHIHTCLSPCGASEMIPPAIIARAKEKNLDIIGICDHNSAENVVAVKKAGEKQNMPVIGGIEVMSSEEVHILAFFDNEYNLFGFQSIVYENLPGINDEDTFGQQFVVNEEGEVIDLNKRLLIGATQLSLAEIVEAIHSLGGLAVASHIDRESFSIFGQLGFIPENITLDALEVSPESPLQEAREKFPETLNYVLVSFSDAHYLNDIGMSFSSFTMESVSAKEIKKALKFSGGYG